MACEHGCCQDWACTDEHPCFEHPDHDEEDDGACDRCGSLGECACYEH